MNILSVFLLFVMTFIAGCASTSFAPADLRARYEKRTNSQDIKIFRTELPKEEFVEVGTLSGNGHDNAIIKKFREEASEQGGDAIISLETYPNGMSATVVRMKK